MRLIMILTSAYLCLIGLQGCATTTTPDSNMMSRPMIASPAERISAGSGDMHAGMSGGY